MQITAPKDKARPSNECHSITGRHRPQGLLAISSKLSQKRHLKNTKVETNKGRHWSSSSGFSPVYLSTHMYTHVQTHTHKCVLGIPSGLICVYTLNFSYFEYPNSYEETPLGEVGMMPHFWLEVLAFDSCFKREILIFSLRV